MPPELPSESAEQAVRTYLADALDAGIVEALGDWEGADLVGVIAWRPERDLTVRAMYGDAVWLSVILALANGHRRQGKARALKQVLVGEAQKAGVKVITSIVV